MSAEHWARLLGEKLLVRLMLVLVAVPDVGLLAVVANVVETEVQAAVVRIQSARPPRDECLSVGVIEVMVHLVGDLAPLLGGFVIGVHVAEHRPRAELQLRELALGVMPGEALAFAVWRRGYRRFECGRLARLERRQNKV